uniref:Uncharacterized protein n=1 Tax=viral metagenome TaxID=1070528 RepID=A0A6M3JB53_9ZZZZ
MKADQLRSYYTYRCKYCGQECFKDTPDGKRLPSGQSPTKLGDYGSSGTPTPSDYDEELYEATTISFTAEDATAGTPAYINDSAGLFLDRGFKSGMTIVVETTSGTNDGTYTIASRGIAKGVLTLSSDDSLTTENAATAGTVTIDRRLQQPNVTRGCGFCGSLNSK